MELGQFSVSLPVQDLETSWGFYERLGFEIYHDARSDNWMILKRGEVVIGLFKGMFDKPMLTFNPGDVRSVVKALQDGGIEPTALPEGEEGPAHAILTDPDGLTILLDQH